MKKTTNKDITMCSKYNILQINSAFFNELIDNLKQIRKLSSDDEYFVFDDRDEFGDLMNDIIFNDTYIYYRFIEENEEYYLEKILCVGGIYIIEEFDAYFFKEGTINEFKKWLVDAMNESERFIINNNLTHLINNSKKGLIN